LERAREVVLRLSPDRLCLGKLLDLRSALPDVVRGVVGVVIDMLLGGGVLVRAASAAIEALAGRSLGQLLMKWGIIKNETVECLKNIVDTAKEASQYIDDEGLRDVVEEVAKKWGWNVDTFRRFVKTAAGKTVMESEVEKMIKEALEKI
jgi:predicted RNA-binding protein